MTIIFHRVLTTIWFNLLEPRNTHSKYKKDFKGATNENTILMSQLVWAYVFSLMHKRTDAKMFPYLKKLHSRLCRRCIIVVATDTDVARMSVWNSRASWFCSTTLFDNALVISHDLALCQKNSLSITFAVKIVHTLPQSVRVPRFLPAPLDIIPPCWYSAVRESWPLPERSQEEIYVVFCFASISCYITREMQMKFSYFLVLTLWLASMGKED